MKKGKCGFRRRLLLLLTLLLLILLVMPRPATADPVDDPKEYVEKMAKLMQSGDEKGLVEHIVANKNTSRKVFNNLLSAMEVKLNQGEPADSPQMKLVDIFVRAIAIVFKGHFNDNSLELKYNQFLERMAAKKKPAPTPSPSPTSKNSYDEILDYYEARLAKGQIEKGDDEKLNRLNDELLAKKDYPRLIRRGEMVARLQDNVGFFEQSIKIRRRILEEYAPKVNDPDRLIRSCLRLAASCYADGDVNSAEKYFLQAEKLAEGRTSHMATLGRYIAAVNLLQISLVRGSHDTVTKQMEKVAVLGYKVDEIPKSFAYEPQDFFLLAGSLARLGDSFRDNAILQILKGNEEKAKSNYLAMVVVYSTLFMTVNSDRTFLNNPLDKLRAMVVAARGLFITYKDMGQHQKAIESFTYLSDAVGKIPQEMRVMEDNKFFAEAAMQMAETSGEMAGANRADRAAYEKSYKMAVDYYRLAAALSLKTGDNIKLVDANLGLAKLFINHGDVSDRENAEVMKEALKNAYEHATVTVNYQAGVMQYHILQARYGEKIKDYAHAKEHYLKAIDILEQLVSRAGRTPEERLAILQEVDIIYKMASEAIIKNNEPRLAFDVLERLRGTQVVTAMDISKIRVKDPKVQKALQQVDRLRNEAGRTEEILQKEQNRDPRFRNREKIAKLNQTLAKNKGEFYQNINLIRAANPEYERLVSVKPAVFSKIQKRIPKDTLLVQYFPGDEKLYIFLVTADSYKIKTVKVSSSELDGLVKTFRASMDTAARKLQEGARPGALSTNNPSHKKTVGCITKLYDYLIEPIKPELADKKVMAVIPTGSLYYLPFHALAREDGKGGLVYFASECQLAYLTSAGLFETVTEKEKPVGKGVLLALGDPDGSLKNAAEEAETLKRIFPGTIVYLKDKATKDRVQNPPDSLSILHLATHSYLNSDNVNDSYILTAGKGADSRLTQGEIFQIPLEGSSLVTLSACQTALGEKLPGSEISSLASAFSIAGTPTILASLWPVADESTSLLMTEFYTALKQGKTKGEAIKAAQLKLISDPRFAHPFYWAPFILIGDWR